MRAVKKARERMKKKFFIACAVLLLLAAVSLIPAAPVYADVLTDLGFSTSSEDLKDYDQRKDVQPYNSKNVTLNPVAEEYLVEIGTAEVAVEPGSPPEERPALKRSLAGDNDLGYRDISFPMDNEIKYVKAAAVDLTDAGKPHAVAELYYRDGSHGNGELYLSIVDPAADLAEPATNEILVFSNSGGSGPLITDYKMQHTLMNLVGGDFDNDGFSEIVVYIPDVSNPRLALYQIENGVIQATPQQTFAIYTPNQALPAVYLTAGDLTGDNLPDLVASGPSELYYNTRIYIFKSQNFSLSKPHVWSDGKNYYESEIYGAAVSIGRVSGWHEHPIGLVIAGYSGIASQYDPAKIKYQELLYLADTAAGAWNFVALDNGHYYEQDFNPLYNQNPDPSPGPGNEPINSNGPITLACAELGATTASFYFNGVTLEGGPGYLNYGGLGGDDPDFVRYYDYAVIAGNFDGNALGREELRIIREKQTKQLDIWEKSLELVKVTPHGVSVTPLAANTTCAALAAPNTDDDTVIVRYKGHDLQYSYPTVLSALASPPYFKDLEHLDGGDGYIGDSSTEISSGEGSGSETHGSVNVTAGAYASLESEVSIFGIKIAQAEYETEFSAGYSWDTSHETEVTTAISYGTFGGQDSVAVYTIPMDVFMYDVWCPGVGGKGGYWTSMNQCFPYPAAYVVIPADKYDEIASRETSLPRIGGELFKHTLGRPETYHKSSTQMYKVKDPIELDQFSTVGFGDAYTAQSIEITETDTDSHTFSADISHRVGGGVAGATAGITFSIGGGGGWATSTIKNVGYTGTLMNMPREAESGGYSFAWKLVAYPYVSDTQSFPVVTYAVDQVRRPPLLPQNLEMISSTENSVTLTWDNVDSNVTGYQLYRYYDFEGSLAGYKKIGDVIPVGTTSFTDVALQPYTSYSYKIQAIGKPYGGLVTESVLGPEYLARTATAEDAPVITQQPVSVEVAAGSRAVFQTIAQPAASAAAADRIFYQWQRYADGRWQVLGGQEDSQLVINGVDKEDAGRYRCAVSQYVLGTPITIYSNPVTLTVNKNNLDIELSFTPSDGYGERNGPVTITAKLTGTDPQIPPTGKINFLFTLYPDPVITFDDEGLEQPPAYPEPVLSIQEVPVDNGNGAQIVWSPPGYGSYDITACYLGDNHYHQQASATSSFTCTDGDPSAASGLRITGIANDTLIYGDTMILGATAWRNGGLQALLAEEVNFESSAPDGLTVERLGESNPHWQLTAFQAGTYELTATAVLGEKTLKVTKNIAVNKAQIALKAVNQFISQGHAPGAFTMQLTAGQLKLEDSLDDIVQVQYSCIANSESPPGEYDIFVKSLTPLSNNYDILRIEQGTVTIEGPTYNIKFRGVSNGSVQVLINNWRILEQDFVTGYDIAAGASVRFSALPDSGYRVEKWIVNGNEVKKSDGSYDTSPYITTNNLNQSVEVDVYFVPDMCSLTYSAGDNGSLAARVGSLAVGSGAVLPAQTVLQFTATPDEGYMVEQWILNNVAGSQSGDSIYLTITQDTDVKVTFAPAEYVPISFAAAGNGEVTAQTADGTDLASGSLVTKGSRVVFTAVPDDANSMIKEWKVNGQVVQGSSSVYTAQNIQQALQVEAVFIDAITYTVNFGAIGSGALTAQVDGTEITSGQQVRGYADIVFTAHPPAGYSIKQWKLGSGVIKDGEGLPLHTDTYTLEGLKTSVTVTVEFESANTYRVDYEVEPGEDGGVNGSLTARVTYAGSSSDYSSGGEIRQGSQVALTAVPDSGYTIAAWTVDGSITGSTEPVYNLDSIQENHEVLVKFSLGNNPLLFAALEHGTVAAAVYGQDTIDSGVVLADGIEVYFTAEPDTGYQVREWRYNGQKAAGSTNSYTLTVNNGGYVEVGFEREYYTLTLGESLSAGVDGSDLQGDQVQGDSSVTVNASPPVGHRLTAWYKDGTLLSGEQGDSYSFTMEQDTVITADFAPQSYVVTFTAGENGTITATADGTWIGSGTEQSGGCSLIFTAQPAEGYRVCNWERNLTVVSGQPAADSWDETYVIDALSKPEYIRVFFEQIPDEPDPEEYLVNFSAGSGGSLSATAAGQAISSGTSVAAGTTVVFTAIPDSGKTVDTWSGTSNGALSADKVTFTINSLAMDENVQVSFKSIPTSGGGGGGGGGITPSGLLVTTSGRTATEKGVTLTFPAGAVEDDIRIQVREVSASAGLSLPDGSHLLSKMVDIVKDSSGNFSQPVTIAMSFDRSQADPEKFDIRICYYDEKTGQWVALDNIQVDLAKGQVSGEATHFTRFAVLAVPKTGQTVEPPRPSLNVPADLTNHWARDSVMKLLEAGIVSGYRDGTFQPDRTVTRAEFTVMLVKAMKLEAQDGKEFADTDSHWARDSIAAAAARGVINGYDENRFGPDDPVTREQAALIITRAVQVENSVGTMNFTDSEQISRWAQSGVAAAVSSGFFNGYPDGSFRPQGNMTRAEALVIIGKLN